MTTIRINGILSGIYMDAEGDERLLEIIGEDDLLKTRNQR